jgi:hypothetical protein
MQHDSPGKHPVNHIIIALHGDEITAFFVCLSFVLPARYQL